MVKVYQIPAENYEDFEQRMAFLNRKAAKLHCPPIAYRTIGEELIHDNRDGRRGLKYKAYAVEVSGETPMIQGWQFIGSIDHTTTIDINGTPTCIVRSIPGEHVPDRYRTSGCFCDHCRINRRRNNTYILLRSGEYKQVGGDCLKDFFDDNDPHEAARWAEILCDLDKDIDKFREPNGGGSGYLVQLVEYLSWVSLDIRSNGWISRTKARDSDDYRTVATADSAFYRMTDKRRDEDDPEPTENDREKAREAIEWAKHLGPEAEASEYLLNIRVLAQAGEANYKSLGYAASILPSHYRTLEREAEAKRQATNSQHIGEIGEKVELDLTLLNVHESYGEQYTTHICKFQDSDGNIIIWFASGGAYHSSGLPDYEPGQRIRLRGTVKEHGEFRGVAQTVITRCKRMESKEA